MARPLGDKCNTLYFKHACLEEAENDGDFDELTVRELTVTECAHVETLEVDTITGDGGCADPNLPNLSFLVNASATLVDDKTLFVQTIQEVNGPTEDPPDGTGVTIIGDIHHGGTGERLFVKEIRDLDDLMNPVFIPFIGTGLIDEAVNGAGIQVTGNHTQFYNPINFGNPAGANFAYDNTSTANVTFGPQDGTAGVPALNIGTMRFHRFGAQNVTPMVTAIWGSAFVTMANAPFNQYRTSSAVVPAGYRPAQNFDVVIATYRNASTAFRYQGTLIFRTDGTIDFFNEADDQGLAEGWFNTDNTKNCGIRAGSCSFEAVAS